MISLFLSYKIPSGKVQQLDTRRGQENWSHGCEELTGDKDCEDSVEAEFRCEKRSILYPGHQTPTDMTLLLFFLCKTAFRQATIFFTMATWTGRS